MTARLAILSALVDEQRGLQNLLMDARRVERAGRLFWCGNLGALPVVLATSGIGKVAAATTTAALIEGMGATRVVFTGVAGGVGPGVAVGDVVVGSAFVQHDMDCSPLFPKYEIPAYQQSSFAADAVLSQLLLQACAAEPLVHLGHGTPAGVHHGLIASGDRFVSRAGEVALLMAALAEHGHHPLAVEMECAAVAQVCHDYGVPFAAVRTISDRADAQAHGDFQQFVTEVASRYSHQIILQLVHLLSKT
jgi:adenosylhomocysteine nucleosidase